MAIAQSEPAVEEPAPADIAKREPWLAGRAASLLIRIAVLAALIGIWQLLSASGIVDPFFISSPSRVASLLWSQANEGTLFSDAWVTLREALKGFVYGSVVGILVGFGLGYSRTVTGIVMPILNLLNTLPRVALAPLFIIWFGIGESSKVALVFSVVVVILLFNTYAGTQTIDRDILTNARLLGASTLQVLTKITLPWCLPWIFAGMRIALAWSLGAAVIGEYLAAQAGIGYRINEYSGVLNQTGVLAGCVALLIMSGFLFGVLGLAERYLLRWRPES